MDTATQLLGNNDEKVHLLCEVKKGRKLYYDAKRAADLLLSITLIALLSPLIIIIAILIYVESPGPIIYSQERVGAKQCIHYKQKYWKIVPFKIFKFRTMILNADTQVHKEYVKALIENDKNKMDSMQGEPTNTRKLVNDKRLLVIGKFLRKFSLDEIPQFWNVIIGDMSLIGPRPALPYEVALYLPWHFRRLEALPGITGLQQIKARSIEFVTQVEMDIEYIENQSWWFDIMIALKTPFAILSGKGAY